MLIDVVQDGGVPVEPGGSWTALFEDLAQEPALLQLLVLFAAGLVVLVPFARLRRLAREAGDRRAVQDFLLAVELAAHGDARGAEKKLRGVLEHERDNVEAHLLLAQVLGSLGRHGEAHEVHVELERAFGLRLPSNRAGIAKALLATGRAREAVEEARRAVELAPRDTELVRLEIRAALAAGMTAEAAVRARDLAGLERDPAARDRARRLAADAGMLAVARLQRMGEGERARALVERLGGAEVERPLALPAPAGSAAEPGESTALTLGHDPSGLASEASNVLARLVERSGVERGLVQPVGPLVGGGGWCCTVCGLGLDVPRRRCPHCGAVDTATAREPAWTRDFGSASRLMDAIEQNEAHVRQLVREAVDSADAEVAERAADELVVTGEPAVPFVLAKAIEVGTDDERLIVVLQRMGGEVLPALFAAWSHGGQGASGMVWRAKRARGARRAVEVVGRVVQGFDAGAQRSFEELLDTEDRDLRKILIDYFLGLAARGLGEDVERVLAHFPSVEVVHRLNAVRADVLAGVLRRAAADSYVTEVLLVEPGFEREIAVLDALVDAAAPQGLHDALVRRGASQRLLRAAIDRLGDPRAAPIVGRLLDAFGDRAIDLQLAEFYDTDRDDALRTALRARLVAVGRSIVPALCAGCLGAGATPLDEDFVALLRGIGAGAVAPLVDAYRAIGFRERVRLTPRHSHRRVMIVRALAAIRGEQAHRGLLDLRRDETDPSLVLRLVQAIDAVAADLSAASGGAAELGAPRDDRSDDSGDADDEGANRVG